VRRPGVVRDVRAQPALAPRELVRFELRDERWAWFSKMLGGASQTVSKIRVKYNGK
jgi:hypothetical protein